MSLLIVGCAGDDTPSAAPGGDDFVPTVPVESASTVSGSRAFEDDLGREVTLSGSRQDVVATTPALVNVLLALDVTPAARPASATEPPEVLDLPSIGDQSAPNSEVLDLIAPDAVMVEVGVNDALVDGLPGIAVAVDLSSYADVLDALRTLGDLFGRADRGEAAVRAIEADLATAGLRNTSYVVVAGTPARWWVAGPDSYAGDLGFQLDAVNVVPPGVASADAPAAGWRDTDVAEIARWNPARVLVLALDGTDLATTISEDPAWATVAAVADGDVFRLSDELYVQAVGTKTGEALLGLASALA